MNVKNLNSVMLRAAKIHFKNGDIDLAMKAAREVLKQKSRPGARLQAVKLVLEHTRDLHKHENPQKQTLIHEFPTELKIRGVSPGGVVKKEGKKRNV